IKHPKLQEIISDFHSLGTIKSELVADCFFCCLGTTLKQTPDRASYYQVDHDYPVAIAEIGRANGAVFFALVSAVGANPKGINSDTKMKGETERDVIARKIDKTCIFRPSLLTGRREETRMLERLSMGIMTSLNPLLIGRLSRYRSISAYHVAKSMRQASHDAKPGVNFYYWKDIISYK